MSASTLSKLPSVQKIIEDVKECVDQLKTEYNDFHRPLTDDSKVLQRFCVKLEFLLRHEQLERSSFLGGRKDYWNFFIEGLNSMKKISDGIKFVKSQSELKTNTGRGRGFIRFCLVYQRLADCLQHCTSNTKLVSQSYRPGSVWRNPSQTAYLVSILYDLNDVVFDLGAHGYDLDNGWPTFSRSDLASGGGQKWNISFSRTSSMSSLQTSMLNSSHMNLSFVDSEIRESDEVMGRRYSPSLVSNLDTQSMLDEDQADSVHYGDTISVLNTQLAEAKTEKDILSAEVGELKAQLDEMRSSDVTKQTLIDSLEQRVSESEQRNNKLVDNLNQLALESNNSAANQVEQMTRYQEALRRCSELEATNLSSSRDLEEIKSTSSALQSRLSDMTQQLADVQEVVRQVTGDKHNLEEHLSTVANSLMEKSSLIEKITLAHSNEVSHLKDKSASLNKQLESLQAEYNDLSTNHSDLQSKLNSATIDLNALQTSHKQLELSQTGASDYTESLKEQLMDTQSNYKSSQEEVYRLQNELIQLHRQHTELSQKENNQRLQYDDLLHQHGQLQTSASGLQVEHENVKKQSSQWEDKFLALKQENMALAGKLSDNEKATAVLTIQHNSLTNERDRLTLELSSLKNEHADNQVLLNQETSRSEKLEDNLNLIKSELESKSQSFDTIQSELSLLKTENESLAAKQVSLEQVNDSHLIEQNLLKQQLSDAAVQLEANQSETQDLKSTLEVSQKDYDDLKCRHELLEKQGQEMEQQLVNIHAAHTTLEQDHDKLQTDYQTVDCTLQELQTKYDALVQEHEATTSQLTELSQQNTSLQSRANIDLDNHQQQAFEKLNAVEGRNTQLEAELLALKKELSSLADEKEVFSEKYKEEQAANVKLSDSLSQVNTEIESLRSNLKSLKAEEIQKSKELSELQSCLESTKLEFANKQTIMEQQIGALRFQLSSHQMEADLAMEGYRQQQEDLQKMSQTISSQEKTVATIEMQLDALQTEKSLDTDRHQQQVEELISLLDDKELDLVSLCEEIEAYKKRCSELTESHETLNQKIIELKLGKGERLAEAENELHQLRDENVILKKRLIKLIKDKDSLWQATDALIFRQKKLSEVKWLDSSKINNCMGCRAAFSLLLRKHHCRLCGQVYCYQCSDNWVNTAASGKKSRVCNLCYIEHTNSDLPAALNSSNITDTNSVDSITLPVTLHDTSWSRDSGGKHSPPSGANRSNVSSTATGDTSQSTDSLTLDVSSTGDTTPANTDTGLQAPVSDDVTEGVEAESTQVTSDPDGVVSQATGIASDPDGVVSQATGIASDPDGVVSQATGIASEPDSVNNRPADNIVSNGFNDFGVEGEVADAVSTVSVPSATRLLKQLKAEYDSVISAESIQSDELIEISINKMSVYTVCVVVDKEETTLGWKFSSQPKAAYFQLTHKPYETSFSNASEHLIPECKCRSHRQEVQGEMISHNSGLYIFSFINKLDRKLEVQYNIRVSVN